MDILYAIVGGALAFATFVLCDRIYDSYKSMEWWTRYAPAVFYYRNVANKTQSMNPLYPDPFSDYYKIKENRYLFEYLDEKTLKFWEAK